jgi:hypothetical protein
VRTVSAHFDGKNVVLDEPVRLKPNPKVHVALPEDDGETGTALIESCAGLSEPAFRAIWDNPLDADYDKL